MDKKKQKELIESITSGSTEKTNEILNSLNYENDHSFNDMKLKLKFRNDSNNESPTYATDSASGFDLRANLDESFILKPLERCIIPTGLYFEIPNGYEIQVRPRSGLAAKHGITVLNSPGTVDCVPKGTKISTPNGDILVEDLFKCKTKKNIYSFNIDNNEIVEDLISDMWVVDNVEMLKIVTEENDIIKIPKTKEVLTDSGWVVASLLTENHKILKIN